MINKSTLSEPVAHLNSRLPVAFVTWVVLAFSLTATAADLVGTLRAHFDIIRLALETDSTRIVALGGTGHGLVPQIKGVELGCHGQHLTFYPKDNHPLPHLFVSMLQRIGLETDQFASTTGTMRGLEMA